MAVEIDTIFTRCSFFFLLQITEGKKLSKSFCTANEKQFNYVRYYINPVVERKVFHCDVKIECNLSHVCQRRLTAFLLGLLGNAKIRGKYIGDWELVWVKGSLCVKGEYKRRLGRRSHLIDLRSGFKPRALSHFRNCIGLQRHSSTRLFSLFLTHFISYVKKTSSFLCSRF